MPDLSSADNVGQQLKILERRIDNNSSRPSLKYGGTWRATNATQLIAGDTDTLLLLNTAVGVTPSGITNNSNGTWTINVAGRWDFSLTYRILLSSTGNQFFQKWIQRGTVSVAENQSSYSVAYFDRGTATGVGVQCNVGDVISCYGRWTRQSGIAGLTYFADDPTNTTSFTAGWRGPL